MESSETEVLALNLGAEDYIPKETVTIWYPDGTVVVTHYPDYDPFDYRHQLMTKTKEGERVTCSEYHHRNFKLRLDEFKRTGELPDPTLL